MGLYGIDAEGNLLGKDDGNESSEDELTLPADYKTREIPEKISLSINDVH